MVGGAARASAVVVGTEARIGEGLEGFVDFLESLVRVALVCVAGKLIGMVGVSEKAIPVFDLRNGRVRRYAQDRVEIVHQWR